MLVTRKLKPVTLGMVALGLVLMGAERSFAVERSGLRTGETKVKRHDRQFKAMVQPQWWDRMEEIKMTFSSSINQSALSSGILAAAAELGVDAVDLATIISYETAGTFSPTKTGPTTKWGTHKGLIQFGEPQAQQFGVDFSTAETALNSQLGSGGAIVNYFRSNGLEEGMGILDMYSIVNAGAPGMYSAKDAKSGGASGTVYEKVTEQMGGHRKKAMSLLGQDKATPPKLREAVKLADAGDVGKDSPNADASAEMTAQSAPLGGAPANKPKKIDRNIVNQVETVQNKKILQASDEFVSAMTPQQKMVEKAMYFKAQLESGEARPFNNWFSETRFPSYSTEYIKGDGQFVDNLSAPQQGVMNAVTSQIPEADSFAHHLMGV